MGQGPRTAARAAGGQPVVPGEALLPGTGRPGMRVATAIANVLKAEGAEYLFCFPVNALIDECARVGIRPIVGRTERTLLNMADGYSRACNARRIGVAAVQHGPGAENAYAGVAQAFADGSPLLFLPGGNPATRADLPPSFDSPQSYRTVTK